MRLTGKLKLKKLSICWCCCRCSTTFVDTPVVLRILILLLMLTRVGCAFLSVELSRPCSFSTVFLNMLLPHIDHRVLMFAVSARFSEETGSPFRAFNAKSVIDHWSGSPRPHLLTHSDTSCTSTISQPFKQLKAQCATAFPVSSGYQTGLLCSVYSSILLMANFRRGAGIETDHGRVQNYQGGSKLEKRGEDVCVRWRCSLSHSNRLCYHELCPPPYRQADFYVLYSHGAGGVAAR